MFNFNHNTAFMRYMLITLCLFYFAASGQVDTSKPTIPMAFGKICYAKTFFIAGQTKNAVYSKALKWLTVAYPAYKGNIVANKATGTIQGIGIFKVPVNTNGNYYLLRPAINILATNDSCTIQAVNFYEKPVEKGITNDYSKIEYRWWDFRNNHPWSQEDYPLFRGLDENARRILTSAQAAIEK